MRFYGNAVARTANIVKDILHHDIDHFILTIIDVSNDHFMLVAVVHDPGELRFFDINVTQSADMSAIIYSNGRLNSIASTNTIRFGRREILNAINHI